MSSKRTEEEIIKILEKTFGRDLFAYDKSTKTYTNRKQLVYEITAPTQHRMEYSGIIIDKKL